MSNTKKTNGFTDLYLDAKENWGKLSLLFAQCGKLIDPNEEDLQTLLQGVKGDSTDLMRYITDGLLDDRKYAEIVSRPIDTDNESVKFIGSIPKMTRDDILDATHRQALVFGNSVSQMMEAIPSDAGLKEASQYDKLNMLLNSYNGSVSALRDHLASPEM